MESSEGLPVTEVAFNILAREGGFQRSLRSLDTGARQFIDFKIQNLEGITHWIRVYPDDGESVVEDKARPGVYLITKGWAVYITEISGDELPGSPMFQVRAMINTEVRIREMPAGNLWIREHIIDTRQIGA